VIVNRAKSPAASASVSKQSSELTDQKAIMSTFVSEYLSLSAVKARGWTDKLIKDFLGEPDKTAVNSHNRSGPPVKLYLISRVEESEASGEWIASHSKLARRRQGAQKAVDTKRTALMEAANRLQMRVPSLGPDKLIKRAVNAYNDRQDYRGGFRYASVQCDPEFLNRITVNFLRHECSSYERQLEQTYGKIGVRDAYGVINAKIYAAISAAYPELAGECERQLREKMEHEPTSR